MYVYLSYIRIRGCGIKVLYNININVPWFMYWKGKYVGKKSLLIYVNTHTHTLEMYGCVNRVGK